MSETTCQTFDYIVIGVGGIGSAALYWLSKLGKHPDGSNPRVLGIEQFKLGHDNGSSQDVSRIIRYMYHHADYVRLAPGAFETWDEVEKESGIKLVTKTGGVFFVDKDDGLDHCLEEYAQAMTEENIRFDRLDGPGMHRMFPQFNTANRNISALYQKDAGFVNAGLANAVHTQLARAHGAKILEHCEVIKVEKEGRGVTGPRLRVTSTKDQFITEKLIVSVGCWTNDILKHFDMQVSVTVTQEQVSYFATPNIKDFLPDKFPVWISVGNKYDFYGLPINSSVSTGVKIGADVSGEIITAKTRNFDVDPARLQAVTDYLQDMLPRAVGPVLYTKTCLYELTPDRHFILDSMACKGLPNVFVFMGCGHGFKFASLVGKIFAELAITGKTQYPLSPNFRIDRPTLQMFDARGNITYGRTEHLCQK